MISCSLCLRSLSQSHRAFQKIKPHCIIFPKSSNLQVRIQTQPLSYPFSLTRGNIFHSIFWPALLTHGITCVHIMLHVSLTFKLLNTCKSHLGYTWLCGKESPCQCRRRGFDPKVGKIPSPRKENGNPLQYSGPGNLMDRGGYQPIVHTIEKSWTRLLLLNNNKSHIATLKFPL